jgi:hypothetical protein
MEINLKECDIRINCKKIGECFLYGVFADLLLDWLRNSTESLGTNTGWWGLGSNIVPPE